MKLKPKPVPPGIRSYLSVFSSVIWLFIIAAFAAVCVIILIQAYHKRIDPGPEIMMLVRSYTFQPMMTITQGKPTAFLFWMLYAQLLNLIYVTSFTSVLVAPYYEGTY